MYLSEEAANRLMELIAEKKDAAKIGIRIMAEKKDKQVSYHLFWEEDEQINDVIIYQDGLKIYMDPESEELVKDTQVFLTKQDGQEGLFIMKNTSNCSTCSETCF